VAPSITAVKGTLVDLVKTTSINRIAYLDFDHPAPTGRLRTALTDIHVATDSLPGREAVLK
jgi:hypothetical protein